MRELCFLFILLLTLCASVYLNAFQPHSFATRLTDFYNQNLSDQSAIDRINFVRPKIYIYTDFGGGHNQGKLLIDLQTSGEIMSAAWKGTLQQELYINDSAKPLSPRSAGCRLAKTFPYEASRTAFINTIVVHVVDPGVGNQVDRGKPQPRTIVLRKDGVVFIGPDNGTLALACPKDSIAGIWEIKSDDVTRLSGIDVKAGGTFHGRDIFCEAAFRLAAGFVSIDDIASPYPTLDLINRFTDYQEPVEVQPLQFACVKADRFSYNAKSDDPNELFEKAFLLGMIQSSLYENGNRVALTKAKKFFLPQLETLSGSEPIIAIANHKTGNVFIGPNDGLGTSFTSGFSKEDYKVYALSGQIFEAIRGEPNNELACKILAKQPAFSGELQEVDFCGNDKDLSRDEAGRPERLKAVIWVDLYGNIKTTAQSALLNEVRKLNASVTVILNGVSKPVIFADTFSQVPDGQLFIYNGSSGSIGPNPHRSNRYIELTANGVFGRFGIDFFERQGIKPNSGDTIWFYFDYVE